MAEALLTEPVAIVITIIVVLLVAPILTPSESL